MGQEIEGGGVLPSKKGVGVNSYEEVKDCERTSELSGSIKK